MRLSILAAITLFLAGVSADGLRNGYERLWLWYAYQLDLTKPEGQQQIGKKCIKWDSKLKICPDTYQPTNRKGKPIGDPVINTALCKGTAPGKNCYFYEFMGWIDGKQYNPKNMWLLPTTDKTDISQQKNLQPDVKAAAEWLSTQHGDTPLEKTNNIPRATIYTPWRVFQGVGEIYNDMLMAVGKSNANTILQMGNGAREANKVAIEGVKFALKSTIIEREIDHSVHIFEEANAKNFAVAKRTEAGHVGDIIDWDATKSLHSSAEFAKFYNDFYHLAFDAGPPSNEAEFKASKTAREHLQVLNDFKAVEAGVATCGVGE